MVVLVAVVVVVLVVVVVVVLVVVVVILRYNLNAVTPLLEPMKPSPHLYTILIYNLF
jgi:hypothetical protein